MVGAALEGCCADRFQLQAVGTGLMPTALLSFLAGLMGTNGIPHFVLGITAREYPNLTGNQGSGDLCRSGDG